jgi:hypothetical protein
MQKIKQNLKCFALFLLRVFFSQKVARIHEDFWNEVYTKDSLSELIKSCLLTEAIVRKNYRDLTLYHENFYTGKKGKVFHDKFDYRFKEWFLKYHLPVIDELEKFLAASSFPLKTYCEIGVGSGSVLSYMVHRFEQIEEFIGLDLNPNQTEENKHKYKHPKIKFITGSAITLIPTTGKSHTLFLTNGGVLELICESDLKFLFQTISEQLKPGLFVLIEPLAPDFNLQTETVSRPFGNELTFSHNYPLLLAKADFRIEFKHEIFHDDVRWIMILASASTIQEKKVHHTAVSSPPRTVKPSPYVTD